MSKLALIGVAIAAWDKPVLVDFAVKGLDMNPNIAKLEHHEILRIVLYYYKTHPKQAEDLADLITTRPGLLRAKLQSIK